jgi:hypothetical protein
MAPLGRTGRSEGWTYRHGQVEMRETRRGLRTLVSARPTGLRTIRTLGETKPITPDTQMVALTRYTPPEDQPINPLTQGFWYTAFRKNDHWGASWFHPSLLSREQPTEFGTPVLKRELRPNLALGLREQTRHPLIMQEGVAPMRISPLETRARHPETGIFPPGTRDFLSRPAFTHYESERAYLTPEQLALVDREAAAIASAYDSIDQATLSPRVEAFLRADPATAARLDYLDGMLAEPPIGNTTSALTLYAAPPRALIHQRRPDPTLTSLARLADTPSYYQSGRRVRHQIGGPITPYIPPLRTRMAQRVRSWGSSAMGWVKRNVTQRIPRDTKTLALTPYVPPRTRRAMSPLARGYWHAMNELGARPSSGQISFYQQLLDGKSTRGG